jgi:para-aminobenzoate synthetase component 1
LLINKEFEERVNSLGASNSPFTFFIDFEGKEFVLNPENALFQLEDFKNFKEKPLKKSLHVKKKFVCFEEYQEAFYKVIEEIKKGNTYLLNLTFATQLEGEIDLEEIFYAASAPFKLYVEDKFVCFSPERFVQIKEDKIKTYPMKGTIDASIENAKQKILADKKEMSEHVMVVDLLRNDLGIVANNVKVERYRREKTFASKFPDTSSDAKRLAKKLRFYTLFVVASREYQWNSKKKDFRDNL